MKAAVVPAAGAPWARDTHAGARPDPGPHPGIGGLGHLAVQYAKAAGFDVVAMTHSKEKEPLLRQLGADQVVSDGRGLAEAGGADVILATSNSYAPVTDAIQGLRPDGRLVLMGVAHEPLSVPTSIMWSAGASWARHRTRLRAERSRRRGLSERATSTTSPG